MALKLTSLFCLFIAMVHCIVASPAVLHPKSYAQEQIAKAGASEFGFEPEIGVEDPAMLAPFPYFESFREVKSRPKRQVRQTAIDLATSHNDRNGNPRPVGRIHGGAQATIVGQDANNYHANVGAGVGSVLWRSRNGRHSIGAGAAFEHNSGRFQGFSYSSRPSFGGAIGYRLRF